MAHKKSFFIAACFLVFCSTYIIIKVIRKNPVPSLIVQLEHNKEETVPAFHEKHVPPYQIKEFSIIMGQKKFSNKQISDHKQLYAGYVNKRNEIDATLKSTDKTNGNITYSAFRGLKVAETFARNAMLLHELYFENIGTGTGIGTKTEKIIIANFGSVQAFKEDLMATALCARGWVLTCYNLDDKKIQNYLLDSHNDKVPVLTIPLLVIDTYEHAYMIDFGINRKEYLKILWDNINWDVVEQRIEQWIS